ncbi:protein tyrosine phosphatase family protein [Pannus brasiliensis CCIBt3594]|uniref:Protein tyrosine phosphatase family protein n=1 Tax=Pannus brasiliensis CCIBt3594 TaxID=1427578 RepID=A0AAW9QJP0_9CHRO
MGESSLQEIRNYYPVGDRLATSGQPTREQFQFIAESGYEVVIDLAPPTSSNALTDEGEIVAREGMIYFNLPVSWDNPTLDDLKFFFALMNAVKERKVWIHCAMNMRVSCFLYLYRKYIGKLPEEEASYPLREIWQPDGVWLDFIRSAEEHFLGSE